MIVRLAAGADTTTCPTCGSEMGRVCRGRRSGLWYRHCQNPNGCPTTTVSDEAPTERPPLLFPTGRLPFEREEAADAGRPRKGGDVA